MVTAVSSIANGGEYIEPREVKEIIDSETGEKQEVEVKKGDRVIINTYSGSDVKYEGEEYKIVRQSDILAVVE